MEWRRAVYLVLLLESSDDSVHCGLKVNQLDGIFGTSCGDEGRLIADVGNVCTRESRCESRHSLRKVLNGVAQLQLGQVDPENVLPARYVRSVESDLSVEPATSNPLAADRLSCNVV